MDLVTKQNKNPLAEDNYINQLYIKGWNLLVMTKKHNWMVFFTLILISIFILGCESKTRNSGKSQLNGYSKDMVVEPKEEVSNKNKTNKNKIDSNKQDYKRTSSGIVTSVPWENDTDFKNAQEKNDAYEMMAAYCTFLPDPLPGEEQNVHIGAKKLTGTIVKPGKIFSQNGAIGPYTKENGYKEGPTYVGSRITTTIGGGVCKISTTLYNVAIMSNLQIIERHAHGMPVSYVPYGQDATVSYGFLDFKFKNDTDSCILIWTEAIDNVLYIGFYGKYKPPKIEWHHEILETKKTKKIYKENPNLASGTTKLVTIGGDGAKVRSWISIEQPNGSVITKQLGISIYSPLPYIYEKGR